MPEVTLTRIAVEDLAKMLKCDAAAIQADVKDGAPVNADGSISLIQYAAWLVRENRD